VQAERQSDIAAKPETHSGKYFRFIESAFMCAAISGRIIRIAQAAKVSRGKVFNHLFRNRGAYFFASRLTQDEQRKFSRALRDGRARMFEMFCKIH
jgi:hypothetical protein